jgi:flagellar biosynthesis/type III secretory pathway M-ring protein FliF/YscJ
MIKPFIKLTIVVGCISLMSCVSLFAQGPSSFMLSKQYVEVNTYKQVSNLLNKIVGADRYVLTVTAELTESNNKTRNFVLNPEKITQLFKESSTREGETNGGESLFMPSRSVTELETNLKEQSSKEKTSSDSWPGFPADDLTRYAQTSWPGFPAVKGSGDEPRESNYKNETRRETNNSEYTQENKNHGTTMEQYQNSYEKDHIYFNKTETSKESVGLVIERVSIKVLLDESVSTEMGLTEAKLKVFIRSVVSHPNRVYVKTVDFPEQLHGFERFVYFLVPNFTLASTILFWGKYVWVLIGLSLLGYIAFWIYRIILHFFNKIVKPKIKENKFLSGLSTTESTGVSNDEKRNKLIQVATQNPKKITKIIRRVLNES